MASELRRDNDLGSDDSFAVVLDTFHDHRNAFLFRINPRGTQYDALISEEGRTINANWDEKWEAETEVTEEGWSAEIRIPFRSIRYSTSAESTSFGLDFERIIRRRNEFDYWNNYQRNFQFEQLSQAGHLDGLRNLQPAFRVRFKPYLSARLDSKGGNPLHTSSSADIGLEDLKYRLTSGLTLDLTANTDFAQAEVDDQVINFDRFPVFFPEKREFFLEGASVFEFGNVRGETSPEIILFDSRRIGLSRDGSATPLLGGAKLTGKIGDRFTLGLIDVRTDNAGSRQGDNFAVFRLKRNLFSRSSAGLFLSNRKGGAGDYNGLIGADHNLVLLDHLSLTGMVTKSFARATDDKRWIGAAAAAWQDDLIRAAFGYYVIEENFVSDLAYLQRSGIRKYDASFNLSPRPSNAVVRQYEIGLRYDHYRGLKSNRLETEIYHLSSIVSFQDGSQLRIRPHLQTENFDEPLRLPGGLIIPPGRYSWWFYPIVYRLSPAHRFSGTLQYWYEHNYFAGSRHRWLMNPVLKFSSGISAEIDYAINSIKLPGREAVTFHQMNNRLSFAFSRKWLTSTLIQYNSESHLVGVSLRLNYIYREGDDLFVVFNGFRRGTGSAVEDNRSIIIKFTHSFDF